MEQMLEIKEGERGEAVIRMMILNRGQLSCSFNNSTSAIGGLTMKAGTD